MYLNKFWTVLHFKFQRCPKGGGNVWYESPTIFKVFNYRVYMWKTIYFCIMVIILHLAIIEQIPLKPPTLGSGKYRRRSDIATGMQIPASFILRSRNVLKFIGLQRVETSLHFPICDDLTD